MIELPKQRNGVNLLSYTQISLWLKSKTDYIRKYFLNEPDKGFREYLEHGKKVGIAIENNDYSGFTDIEKEALQQLERLDLFERPIDLHFEEGFSIIGYIDSCDKELTRILDYKVGSSDKLKEYEKQNYIQLLIYALAIQQETGKLPQSIGIEFIERGGNAFKQEPLLLTGKVEKLNLELSEERCIFAKQLCIKVANEISDYYKVFKKLNIK